MAAALLMSGIPLSVVAPAYGAEPDPQRLSPVVLATQQADPAVVNIQGHKTVRTESPAHPGDSATQQVNGMGSGVIIDPRGYVLTNLHVVQGVANIDVTLSTGKKLSGSLIDYDPDTDLALVKIQTDEPLPVIRMGTSADLKRGETVIAIGNPFGYQSTVTTGIISALNRDVPVNGTQEYRDLIQTDASINVAVRMGAQGIGFAIPVDEALEVAARLIERHRGDQVTAGVSVKTSCADDLTSDKDDATLSHTSVDVTSVIKGGPAATAGLQVGDRIVQANGQTVIRRLDWELILLDSKPGTEVPVRVDRDGDLVDLKVPVQEVRAAPVAVASSDPVIEQAWSMLGMKLTPAEPEDVVRIDSNYRGGLRVTSVRAGSPAAKSMIQQGDILVGILTYETTTVEDLAWVLKNSSKELRHPQGAKFFIVRGKETLYGAMKVNASSRNTRY